MKKIFRTFLVLSCALAGSRVRAADFVSGSDGSYGAIDITGSTTTALPPDGVINATTVHVGGNYTVWSFSANAANTPVVILATGDIVIDGYQAGINVNGASENTILGSVGGPGGFAGGKGVPDVSTLPSSGEGPGGGDGGAYYTADPAGDGTFGCSTDTNPHDGKPYGNAVLLRLVGGSGGGGGSNGYGGGGGGGAILLASSTKILLAVNSYVIANGGTGSLAGSGSGGAVRLVAPIIEGGGGIQVTGPAGNHGRVRIDRSSPAPLSIGVSPPCAYSAGNIMKVTADSVGSLRLVSVAGHSIATSDPGPVFVELPPGSPASQNVIVRATGYSGVVPIQVVLTPESGPRQTVNASIDMSLDGDGDGVLDVVVGVQIPANTPTHVEAWTR